jgi:hypothetical protein
MSESKNKAYSEMGIEPWDVIIKNFNPSAVRGYFIGEALAYLMRYDGAGHADRCGIKDLQKAKHFIERLIQYDESKKAGPVRTEISASIPIAGGGGANQTFDLGTNKTGAGVIRSGGAGVATFGGGGSGGSGMTGVGAGGGGAGIPFHTAGGVANAGDSLTRYRVWPDGTVQDAKDSPHSWMSDDYCYILAVSSDHALAIAKSKGFA